MLTRPAKTPEQQPVQQSQRRISRDIGNPHDQRAHTPNHHPQTDTRHTTIISATSTLPRNVTLSFKRVGEVGVQGRSNRGDDLDLHMARSIDWCRYLVFVFHELSIPSGMCDRSGIIRKCAVVP